MQSDRVFSSWEGTVYNEIKAEEDKTDDIHPIIAKCLARERIKSKTPEWHEIRKKGHVITATDIAPILGETKYDTAEKLLRRKKTGEKRNVWENAVNYGNYYESEAARVYSLITQNELIDEDIGFILGTETKDYIGATPDFFCKHRPIIVEIKTLFKRQSDHKIPSYYIPQIMCQMAVTGIHRCHLVQYKPPSVFTKGHIDILCVDFDQRWWDAAEIIIAKFYARLCDPSDIPPPPPKRQKQEKKLVVKNGVFKFIDNKDS